MAFFFLLASLTWPHGPVNGVAVAAAPSNARHTGLEPPGGPRPLENLPGTGTQRNNTDGLRGYTDAYGNRIENREPKQQSPRKRPLPGAYGAYGKQDNARPLPDPATANQPPAWSFN